MKRHNVMYIMQLHSTQYTVHSKNRTHHTFAHCAHDKRHWQTLHILCSELCTSYRRHAYAWCTFKMLWDWYGKKSIKIRFYGHDYFLWCRCWSLSTVSGGGGSLFSCC